jgi:hypothetical protein
MKAFTLQELNDFFWYRRYVTKSRFHHYFKALYGMNDEEVAEWWKIFERFPYAEIREKKDTEIFEEILEKLEPIIDVVRHDKCIRVPEQAKKIKKKIYYRHGGSDEVLSVVLDLNDAADVIAYAELLKSDSKVIMAVDYVETVCHECIAVTKEENIDVYDGDIFIVQDEAYRRSREDNIYVCHGGVYYRLLYTRGRGYLRNGEPDYDRDSRYNSNVIALSKSATRMGNIHVDCSILVDNVEQ